MNFFERLKKQYYHTDPVEHIIGPQIIKVAEYDDLYENQTRFDGTVWKNFKEKQNLKCVFHEDLRDIDRAVDIMCLWFFRACVQIYISKEIYLNTKKDLNINE